MKMEGLYTDWFTKPNTDKRDKPKPRLIIWIAVIPSIPSIKLKRFMNHSQIKPVNIRSTHVGNHILKIPPVSCNIIMPGITDIIWKNSFKYGDNSRRSSTKQIAPSSVADMRTKSSPATHCWEICLSTIQNNVITSITAIPPPLGIEDKWLLRWFGISKIPFRFNIITRSPVPIAVATKQRNASTVIYIE